jgi:A/G-specific adenine glycosylase
MLQQTRVDTVTAYYVRWMARFPTLESLARASEQEVLKLWEGLGYYGRARNLHRAAQVVMEQYGGHFPDSRAELEKLPGIGRYTAGAIASMAFGKDEPALDGNIRRVLARVFNLTAPLRSPEGQHQLEHLLKEHLPAGQAGTFNQALMDLGAIVCTPRSPACQSCPVKPVCQSSALGVQEQRPVREGHRAIPHFTVTAAVIQREGRVLIARRPDNGLLGGMWEFPGGKQEPGEPLVACLEREIWEELGARVCVGAELGIFRHAYTHFKVTLHAFYCDLVDGHVTPREASEIRWVRPQELGEYPMGKIDRRISQVLSSGLNF